MSCSAPKDKNFFFTEDNKQTKDELFEYMYFTIDSSLFCISMDPMKYFLQICVFVVLQGHIFGQGYLLSR